MNKNIITDQEAFFNQSALDEKVFKQKNIFYNYVNKEQVRGFNWLSESKSILEYGCGTGTSLDLFFKDRKKKDYTIYGVDIAELALEKAKKKYPDFKFYKISNNKIPQIKNNSLEAAYMLHVLHHSHNHEDIFNEIYSKLEDEGKFFLSDLSSSNFIVKLGRILFLYLPVFVRNKFGDDLVVKGRIPEKYKVDIEKVVGQLKMTGFSVEEIGYGHLFFFIFGWLDRFIPLSKFKIVNFIYLNLIKLENWLLKYKPLQNQAEVFYIMAIKK